MEIGNMPDAEQVSGNGYIIYTDDGVHGCKMTVDRLAKEMDMYIQNDENEEDEAQKGGFNYWNEYIDYQFYSYLRTENYDLKRETLANLYPYSSGRDIWFSNFQFDAWDSSNVPNHLDIMGLSHLTYSYRPYISFIFLHKIGTSIQDFIHVSGDTYKIAKDKVNRYKAYLYYLYPYNNNSAVTDPTEDQETIVYPTSIQDIIVAPGKAFQISLSGIDFIGNVYEIDKTYINPEATNNDIFNLFDNNPVNTAGYTIEQVIDDYTTHLDTTEHEDSDTYIYITNPLIEPDMFAYSEDGLSYYSDFEEYDDIIAVSGTTPSYMKRLGSLLNDSLLGVTVRPTYTAICNRGIYFGIPFTRYINGSSPHLELSIAYCFSYDKIRLHQKKDFEDVIFVDDMKYTEFIDSEASSFVVENGMVVDVRLGDFSILDEETHIASLQLGDGLTVYMDNSDPPKPYLGIDESKLQTRLTPGTGVTLTNNVLSAEGEILDVQVDYTSVVDQSGVANIILPNGLKETRLQSGNYTEPELVQSGNDYVIYRLNVTGLSNDIIEATDNVQFGDPINDTYTDNTALSIIDLNIPANSSGLLVATVNIDGSEITDGVGYLYAGTSPTWPSSDSDLYTSQVYDVQALNDNAQTALRSMGTIVNNSNGDITYHLLVKIHANKPSMVYGHLTYIQNIDI